MNPELRQRTEGIPQPSADPLEMLGMGRWEADPSMVRFHAVGPGAERILGIPAERWLDEPGLWLARVHPLDRAAVLRDRASHRDHVVDYRLVAGDGRTVWVREAVSFARGADGVVSRLHGVFHDVSSERRNAARLAAQAGLSTLLAGADRIEEIAVDILRTIGEALGYELGSFWKLDEPSACLRCEAVWVAPHIRAVSFESQTRAATVAPGEGLPGRVLQTGRAMWVTDVTRESGFPRAEVAAREGLRAGVAVPIGRGGRTYGVLELFTRDVRAPDEALVSILESLGTQLAQAMERRLAEAHARDLGVRRAAILEAALDAIVAMDATGRVLEWNPAAERTFGYARDEVVGRSLVELIVAPQHREGSLLARQLQGSQGRRLGERLELVAMRKDGTSFPVELAIVRIPVDGPALYTGHFRDISARQASFDALRESESRYRFLADSIPQQVWTTLPAGTFEYANARATEYLGVEGTKGGWDAIAHPQDLPRMHEAWGAARASGEAFEIEMRLRRRTGEHRWHLVRASPLKDDAGRVLRWFGSSTDIEEKKRQEQRLADLLAEVDQQRRRLDNIVASVPGVVWEAWGQPDAQAQRIDFVSDHVEAMLGYSTQEWLSTPNFWLTIVHPDDRADAAARSRAAFESGEGSSQQFRWRRKDGSYVWVQAWNVIVKDGLGRPIGMRGVTLDVSKLKETEEALRASVKELDQFAYVTSHDLKAPLRGIANLSRWIEEDLGAAITPDSRAHLDLLRGRVQRMESLIDAILAYSRVGRVKAKPERVEVSKLLAETIDLLAPPDGFRVEVATPMPTLTTERLRLQQVFMNLIGNAIKHHPDKARGRVEVRAVEHGRMWRFSVADNGAGIAPRYHDKIFVIFQTLEARDKVEGTGIGLALVKKIVEGNGGTIAVDSDVGRGAAFQFTWPK
ncbi:MAG TPA: PAS domain S-box protein [Candidatus Thermoplasmatota archaeon]|nr:PAS domain S-box protein [Candidatus Thermoplasmatota archaeon]